MFNILKLCDFIGFYKHKEGVSPQTRKKIMIGWAIKKQYCRILHFSM